MTYYITFTETFIENYCVNKDRPKLNCDGKCELSKLLERDSSEQDQQKDVMMMTSVEIVFYVSKSDNHFNLSKDLRENQSAFGFTPQLYVFDYQKELIKPPEFLI